MVFLLASLAGSNVVFGIILITTGSPALGSLNIGCALFLAILALRSDQ